MNTTNLTLLIPESKKYMKGTNQGSHDVRAIFNYYQSLGYQQTYAKEEKYKKLYNHAFGKINMEDYVQTEMPEEIRFKEGTDIENIEIQYFPIIPNIRNGILGEYDRKHIEYSVRAVNPENTNNVLEAFNSDLVSNLVQGLERLFLSENPNPTEEQTNQFQQSTKLQSYYTKTYRTEIETWANHIMKVEDQRHSMKSIERKLLDQIIVTENPTVHVAYSNDHYFPETLNEKDTFYLKSPMAEDYSEGMMFGWNNHSTIGSVINRWSNDISAEDVKKLEGWGTNYMSNGLVVNNHYDSMTGNRTQDFESTQNFIFLKNRANERNTRYDEFTSELIKETHIYFLLPRKKGMLYYKSGGQEVRETVDENFKPTIKPIYVKGMPKTEHHLLEGEHVEWYYENELWYGVKLSVNQYSGGNAATDTEDCIWAKLQRHEVQFTKPGSRYGTTLPIHGGSISNYYNESFSVVQKCVPWQIFYNWIWNRNQQLLSTEIGKFLAINELAVPNDSLEGSWGKDSLTKWAVTGRDTGMAPVDVSLTNMGQSAVQLHGGIGQVIDLNKTQDILEKTNLARVVKLECYAVAGLTEEYLYGNIQPRMSGAAVAQGHQRTTSQLQWIFTRLDDVLRLLRGTMLQCAQSIESMSKFSTVSYTTSEEQRVLFKMSTDQLPLAMLDIYVQSSVSEMEVLEKMKQYALTTNTMGADSFEMATIQSLKTVPDMLRKLKTIKEDKQRQEQEKAQREDRRQSELIQSQKEAQQLALQEQRSRDEREHEKDIMVAQIRSLGYAEDDAAGIRRGILELQDANLKQREYYDNLLERQDAIKLKTVDSEHKRLTDKGKLELESKLKLKASQQKDRELDIREKEANASNKRTEALKKK